MAEGDRAVMSQELAEALFREVFAKHSVKGAPFAQGEYINGKWTRSGQWVVACSCGAANAIPEDWSAEDTQEEHLISALTRLFSHQESEQ